MGKVSTPVVIGVDPHKRINAVVVVDAAGQVLARGTFPMTTGGLRELAAFARRFGDRTWAIEGCNGVGKHLSQRLVASHERVVDVSTRRSSLVRVFAGGNGRKNDDTDALSIALVGLRSDDLPVVRPDDRATTLRLLAHRRAELVSTRTQAACRLQRELQILLPGGTKRSALKRPTPRATANDRNPRAPRTATGGPAQVPAREGNPHELRTPQR